AAQLQSDPAAIYEYVKNQVGLELRWGLTQSAPETYRQGRGGPADLAALLIALYRAAEIPARYVTGQVRLDKARLANVLGVPGDDTAKVLGAMSATGVPHQVVEGGGTLSHVVMEHVWVEVYVPYGHYRGLPLDRNANKRWIPLDPGLGGVPRRVTTFGAHTDPLDALGVSASWLESQ